MDARKFLKFLIIAIFHGVVVFFVYVTLNIILGNYINGYQRFLFFRLSLILIFSGSYLLLMWHDLYSYEYHRYLKSSNWIVLKNIAYSLILSLIYAGVSTAAMSEYILDVAHRPELYIDLLFLITIVSVFFMIHYLEYSWIKMLSRHGYFKRNVIIVGNPDKRFPLDELFQDIGGSKDRVGKLTFNSEKWRFTDKNDNTSTVNNEDIQRLMYKLNIGEIIVCLDNDLDSNGIHEIVSFCRKNSISYYVVPNIDKLANKPPWNIAFSYIPIIERYSTSRDMLIALSFKRFIDIVISAISLILLSPVFALVASAIKLEDGGPVIYTSNRVGVRGKLIRFYKFRSMTVNAEKQKAKLIQFNERKDGPLFKMSDDPRVTKVGNFIRKYSLDELPQLFNVLIGNMSIIGPRPHLPEEVKEYSDRDYLRLECIPGISCLPQIKDRNGMGFREWVELDLKYRENWSLKLDFFIMYKTFGVVLKPLFGTDKKK